MRRLLCFVAVLLILSAPFALAHSGRTDSDGGHYDRSTGEYHYHHGMSAHQHPGGVCPYATKSTVKPTATTKPKTYSSINAYRSDTSVKTATAKPTAAPLATNPKKGSVSMIDVLLSSDFVCLYLFIVVVILGAVIVRCRIRIEDYQQEIKRTVSQSLAISDANIELKRRSKLVEAQAKENDQIRKDTVRSRQSSAKWCAMYNASNDRCKVLQQHLNDLKMENAIIRAALSNSSDANQVNAQVYVSTFGHGKYHTAIHGNWNEYKLISLKSAIAKGYTPCSICFLPVLHDSKRKP